MSQSGNRVRVILSPSEGSAFLPYLCRIGRWRFETTNQKQILRRSTPQNDIATQSLSGEQAVQIPRLFPPRVETVSQCTNCPYLSSRAEREILHFQLHAKKRFLALGSK
jgi:hypothetical protein